MTVLRTRRGRPARSRSGAAVVLAVALVLVAAALAGGLIAGFDDGCAGGPRPRRRRRP
jgi:hypothetical protein